MALTKPIISEIAYRTYAINEFGMATAMLIEGKDHGILFDTGCGMCNMREVADSIAHVPYSVVISHAHGDHTASVALFDHAYVHKLDLPAMYHKANERSMLSSYPEMMRRFGTFDIYDISPEQQMFYDTHPEYTPIEEGHIFDLGDRKLEVIWMPGHTLGSITLLDPKERIAFTGDACNGNLGYGACSINTALAGLYRLKSRQSAFDRNFNNHVGYGGNPNVFSQPASVLDDCIWICESLLRGTVAPQPAQGLPAGMAGRLEVRHGAVRISFPPGRLLDEGEASVLAAK